MGMLLGPRPPPLSCSESTSSTLTEGCRLWLELSEVDRHRLLVNEGPR